MIAITREPSPQMSACELTFVHRAPIDFGLARQQHAAYCDCLQTLGVEVTRLPTDELLPDCCFVEDMAIVFDEVALVGRPHLSRLAEQPRIAEELAKHRPLKSFSPAAKIEGGDVLVIGDTVLVGRSSRTNLVGIHQLEQFVKPMGLAVRAVDVTGCLHLKTACTAIDEQTLLINPNWIAADSLSGFQLIEVPAAEPFAANTVPIAGSLLAARSAPDTASLLRSRGRDVITLDISEFQKAEAGLSCLSLLVPTTECPG